MTFFMRWGKDGPELFKKLGGNMNYYKEALHRFNEQKKKNDYGLR